ncbi:MAG: hypothetical protein AAF604_18715 [Acidobacteriota bacterium]
MRTISDAATMLAFLTAGLLSLACGVSSPSLPDAPPEADARAVPRVLHSVTPSGWFEPTFSESHTSRDGRLLFWTVGGRPSLLDTESGALLPAPAQFATQRGDRDLAFFTFSPSRTWLELGTGTEPRPMADAPPHRTAVWSRAGAEVAWTERSPEAGERLVIRRQGATEEHDLEGPARGMVWSDDGDQLFVLVQQPDGSCTLFAYRAGEGSHAIRRGLDAPLFWSPIAYAEDPARVLVALASPGPPVAAERHAPFSDRDLDLWAVRMDGSLQYVAGAPSADDFSPSIADGRVTWTRNEVVQQVVRMAAGGGPMEVIARHGQLPVWSPDGEAIAYTVGPWRLADMVLNLDAWISTIGVDGRVGPGRPLVVGWHEDFTPTWSPNGRWIAYHSHRAPQPVSSYSEPGSTDDVYLKRADVPEAAEIRLSDFGFDVGMVDWSPDSRKLAFCSHRHDEGNASSAWVITIDPTSGELLEQIQVRTPAGAFGVDNVIFGPQGELALVTSEGDQRKALWVRRSEGGQPVRIAEFESSTIGDVDWSPDGTTLLFSGLAGERMGLWEVAATAAIDDGASTARLLAFDPGADLVHPRFSDDGLWLAASRIQWRKSLLSAPL